MDIDLHGKDNLLLAGMPDGVYARLAKRLVRVELKHGEILHRPGATIERVYFPLNCLISVTAKMQDGSITEVGVIGSREMVGVNAFMGGRETTQTEYITQIPGSAVRMGAEFLLEEFDQTKSLRDLMLRYTQAFIAQISQNVACNRRHGVNERLARWLLESRDRIHSEDLGLSHEFISQMLGIRRAGVTEACQVLSERGLIKYGRKTLRIIDSLGLEAASCECYGLLIEEYNRILGPVSD